MGTRRISREVALQFLYQEDSTIQPGQQYGYDLPERFELFCALYQANKKARPYALELLRGVSNNIDHIDHLIRDLASHWRLIRIAPVDRNLLRIAVYEILARRDVPPEVAIDEAIEIAKRFAGEDSPKFINGILNAVKKTMDQE